MDRHTRQGDGPPRIPVIIVNYNGARHIAACLSALAQQTIPSDRFDVIVVDNASPDGSAAIVETQFPQYRLMRLNANVGFAEANNLAARSVLSTRVVLLNNDTIPDPFWLEELLDQAERTPDAIIGSKLIFAHNSARIQSAGLWLLRDGRGDDAEFQQTDHGQVEGSGPVFAACGAAVLLHKNADGSVLDGDYFMYSEDLNVAWQAQLEGKQVHLAPRAVVRHVHGAAAGDATPLFRYYVERNRFRTAFVNGDLVLAAYSALVLLAKVGQAIVRNLFGRQSRIHLRAVCAAFTDNALSVFKLVRVRGTIR